MTMVEVADCVGGRIHTEHPEADPEAARQIVVTGAATVDSRAVEPGGLFVAVPGEHVDGHDFATAAVRAGAAAVLCSRPVDAPCILVEDPVAALGLLARDVLQRLPGCTVVGITGSQGKTSTKDMLAQVLEGSGTTIAPQGSYNNEIGVPLTALRADRDTRFLVIEMGAKGRGHISYLAEIVRPHVAIVLNVGVAHIGEFGDRGEIATSKGELVEALPADGVAVLNADDDLVRAMANRTVGRVVTFGAAPTADVRLGPVELDRTGHPQFTLVSEHGEATVRLQLVGEHQAVNAAAVATGALALGLPWDRVVTGLGEMVPRSRWRMEVTERPDGVTVVNDAYNANPDSMRAALKTLAVLGGAARRTIAVLGEMLELGAAADEEHDAIGRLAVRLNVSRLIVVGEGARPIHLGASLEGSWAGESVFVPDVDEAVERLRGEIAPDDVVLVKASRDAGLERVAEALLSDGEGRG